MKMGRVRMPGLDLYVVNDPKEVRKIMVDEVREFPKSELLHELLNPLLGNSIFPGQKIIAKSNHIFLYISIFIITISGALKKLFNGEILNIFILSFEIKDNFYLADLFYDIHIVSNYILITLITIHILAVIVHKFIFKENLIKKIL